MPSPYVLNGIDVLLEQDFAPLRGRKLGLITNHTGCDQQGRSIIDLLQAAPGVEIKALFSPEHGLRGIDDAKVASSTDEKTGLPIHSLYGETMRPKPEWLEGLDTLLFDIQDVGVRFYTYTTTMAYGMEAAAQHGLKYYVLDRANPINGAQVAGPVNDAEYESFVAYHQMPVRHGMTHGELARWFNDARQINADLEVVPLRGWRRDMWGDQTGQLWIIPSPNLRNLKQAILYPGVGMLEGTNVSVGRGTDTPFEYLGAPWVEPHAFVEELNRREIKGVSFVPTRFTPQSPIYQYCGELCGGVYIMLNDRSKLQTVVMGLNMAQALCKLYPDHYRVDNVVRLLGDGGAPKLLTDGTPIDQIIIRWQERLNQFMAERAKHLIYQ